MEFYAPQHTPSPTSSTFYPLLQRPLTDPSTGSSFPSLARREEWLLQQQQQQQQQHAGGSSSYASGASGVEEAVWRMTVQSPEGMDGPYPERAGEPDCAYYMRTGLCGYGMRCRFNHPSNRRLASTAAQGRGEYPERIGQPECQYFLKTGTCKFGPSCKYHHPGDKGGSLGTAQLNVVNLPLRPGEKDCVYYMRTGNCKYGVTCKFNHPQPRAVGTLLSMPGSPLFRGGSAPAPQQAYPPSFQTWPIAARGPFFQSPRIQAPSSFAPLLLPSPQGLVSMPGWNAYQGSIASPDRQQQAVGTSYVYGAAPQQDPGPLGLHATFSPYVAGSGGVMRLAAPPSPSATGTRDALYPQRPGHSECQYYMKTGECKFGNTCKFHHPRDRNAPQAAIVFSPMGLPLRPGAPQCTFYNRYGFCRFGTTCKFDHPFLGVPYTPSASSLVDMPFLVRPSSTISLALPPTRQPSMAGPSIYPGSPSGKRISHRQSSSKESLEEMGVSTGIGHQDVSMQSSSPAASVSAGSSDQLDNITTS